MQTKFLLTKNWALNILMLIMFSFMGIGQAIADVVGSGSKEDPYVLENGTTLTLKAYQSFYAKFTAPADGIFSLYTKDSYALYTDESFSQIDESANITFNGSSSETAYYFNCKAGVTYYIGNSFVMVGGTVTAKFNTEAEPLVLREISPEAGSVFNAGKGSVELTFNQKVQIASVTVNAGTSSKTMSANVNGVYVSVDVKDWLNQMYDEGKVKEGNEISFKFKGVAPTISPSKLYNGNGELDITYTAGKKPLQLVSSTNTPMSTPAVTTFKSFYTSDDNQGIVTLEFSDEVNFSEGNKPTATLTYGNMDQDADGEYYTESLPILPLGSNILMVNLKDKLRRAQDMVTSGTVYDGITLSISHVKDMDGNYAYGSGSGVLGSFAFNYKLSEINYTVDTDWALLDATGNPTNKDVIDSDTKSIELWMSENDGQITFNGVEFKYTESGTEKVKTMTLSEIKVDNNGNETTITIPVPNIAADAGSDIAISLKDVERPDGITTSIDPAALSYFTKTFTTTGITESKFDITSAIWMYEENEGNIVEVNMINGNIGVLTRGSKSVIKTNKDNEIGYVEWEIRGVDNPDMEYIRAGYVDTTMTGKLVDGFTIEWRGEGLTAGKDYTFTLQAWKNEADKNSGAEPNVGEAMFIIHGTKQAYIYSDVVMKTDISQPIRLASANDNYRTIEFSAPVTLNAVVNLGMGTSADCTVEPSADRTAWTVTIPEYVMSQYGEFSVNVFAKDDEGRAVNKTENGLGIIMGTEDNTWFQIDFVSESLAPDFTVTPANESVLESLSTVTFGYEGSISINWNNSEKITIYNRTTREKIAEFSGDDVVLDEDPDDYWAPILSCHITLPEPVTAIGVYDVNVPAGFFVLGEQFDSNLSKATSIVYEIKEPVEPFGIEISPTAGLVSEIPSKLIVTVTDRSSCNFTANPTLTDNTGNSYPVHNDFDWGIPEMNKFVIILDNGAITADGIYTLTIPAGSIIGDDETDLNKEDFVFIYTINLAGITELVNNEGGKVDVYTLKGTLLMKDADASAVNKLAKGMYIINGKKVFIR